MTNAVTSPPPANTLPTGAASFLSVLTSTVGLPALGSNRNDARDDEQNDSDAANTQHQSQDASRDSAPAQKPNVAQATPFTDITGSNLTILPVQRFHAVLSTANSAARVTRDAVKDQQSDPGAGSQKNNSSDNAVTVPAQMAAADIPATLAATPTPSVAAIPATAGGTTAAPAFDLQSAASSQPQDADVPRVNATGQTGAEAACVIIAAAHQTPRADSEFSTANVPVARVPAQSKSADSMIVPAETSAVAANPMWFQPPVAAGVNNAPTQSTTDALSASAVSASPAQFANQQQGTQNQTQAQPTQVDETQTSDVQQSGRGSNADAGSIPTAATRTASVHSSNDRNGLLAAAEAVFQVPNQPMPLPSHAASSDTRSNSNAQPATGNSATTAQPGATGSAQSSTVKTVSNDGVLFPAVQALPDVSFTSSASTGTMAGGKSSDGKVVDAGNVKDANGTSAPSSEKSASAQNASPAAGTQAQSAQGGNSAQYTQTDASGNSAIAARVTDAAPVQTVPVHIATQQPAASGASEKQHVADAASTSLPASSGDGVESMGSSGVNTAKLLQTLSETQMQVGMRSAEFGDISIRTVVSQQQMVAQITVDHGDLSRAIAQHAPAAQAKLGDDLGLRAAIEVTHSGTGFSNEGGNAQQEQRSFVRPVEALGVSSSAETESITPRTAATAEDADRLDIRA